MRIFLNAKLQYASKLRNAFAPLVAHEFMPLTQTITQAIDTQTTQKSVWIIKQKNEDLFERKITICLQVTERLCTISST